MAADQSAKWIVYASHAFVTRVCTSLENRKREKRKRNAVHLFSRLPCFVSPRVLILPAGGSMRIIIEKLGFDIDIREEN